MSEELLYVGAKNAITQKFQTKNRSGVWVVEDMDAKDAVAFQIYDDPADPLASWDTDDDSALFTIDGDDNEYVTFTPVAGTITSSSPDLRGRHKCRFVSYDDDGGAPEYWDEHDVYVSE